MNRLNWTNSSQQVHFSSLDTNSRSSDLGLALVVPPPSTLYNHAVVSSTPGAYTVRCCPQRGLEQRLRYSGYDKLLEIPSLSLRVCFPFFADIPSSLSPGIIPAKLIAMGKHHQRDSTPIRLAGMPVTGACSDQRPRALVIGTKTDLANSYADDCKLGSFLATLVIGPRNCL